MKELRKIYTNDSFLLLYLNKIIKVIENYQEHKQLTLSHSYYIIDYPDSINNKYVINGLEFLDLFLENKKIQFNKLQNN